MSKSFKSMKMDDQKKFFVNKNLFDNPSINLFKPITNLGKEEAQSSKKN